MEPFYTDPHSTFKQLVEAIISAVADPAETVTVAVFNQTVPGNESPRVVFTGARGPGLAMALESTKVAQKPSGALADTDFQEAVTKTVIGPLKSKPGIIWIFTNNKNSPGNSPETAKRNREFYALLHDEPSIVRSVAFPLAMPVAGKTYTANGLMVYGLAYGRAAETRLIGLVSGPVRKILTEPPARLKPLDQESVRFIPGHVRNAPSHSISLAKDGHTVILDVDVSNRQPIVEFTASVENSFYPYVITRAGVIARFIGRGWATDLQVKPQSLSDVQPGAAREVTVSLEIPLAEIPSLWSPSALSSMGKTFSLPGAIELSLGDQNLQVAETFRLRLAQIFPGDPISDIFTPSTQTRASIVQIPILLRITYPVYPLLVVGFAALAIAAIPFGLVFILGGAKHFDVLVDGQSHRMLVKAFKSTSVRSQTGDVIGTLRRRIGTPSVSDVAQGHNITVKT
jgi:hypothetical protein